jgi:carbohydrate/starch-binding protein with CBM21 domain
MAQQPVRLKYAESDNFSPGGGLTGVNNTKVTAKVKNIAFAKDVALHYARSDGTWVESPLSWQANFGAYDLFARTDNTFVTTQFVIRYSVDGQTFWDNNGGANYQIDEIRPNTVGGNVNLNKATARRGTEAGGGFVFTTSWVEGEIFVKNLSFNKRVGIRLSANGWASFQDTDASFNGNVPVAEGLSQVEAWKFKTPELNLDPSSPSFLFAVFYNNLDTGEWFWDNNFVQDYTLSKNDLATDE